MSDLWIGVLLGVLFSIPVGIGVNLASNLIQKRLRARSAEQRLLSEKDKSGEPGFARYLGENPQVAVIVWANYRWGLMRNAADAVSRLLLLVLLGVLFYVAYREEPQQVIQNLLGIIPAILLVLYSIFPPTRRLFKMRGRARRIAELVNRRYPISSNLSDEDWKGFRI